MHRIEEIRRLHHIVLLVAAQTVLRAESGGQADIRQRGQRVERMGQIGGNRGWVSQQGNATTGERAAQIGFGKQSIESETYG